MTGADHSPEVERPMVEIVRSQRQEVGSALDVVKPAIERKLQSAERPTKSATTATRKATSPKCATHRKGLILRVKEILFS